MYTVHAVKNNEVPNTWPPCARRIRRQGRPGREPRPVVAIRVKAPAASKSIVNAKTMPRENAIGLAKTLKAGGASNVTIAKGMNLSESSVRSLLKAK